MIAISTMCQGRESVNSAKSIGTRVSSLAIDILIFARIAPRITERIEIERRHAHEGKR